MAFSWLSSWDPRPAFPSYTGPYSVGSTDVEIPVESLPQPVERPDVAVTTVAFRVYYPCRPPPEGTTPKPVNWISAPQRDILSGYARFCGAGSTLADLLSLFPNLLNGITIPVVKNATLADPPAVADDNATTSTDQRWPTLIFSHGLGGSRNAYSHICGSLASYGMVVIAPDHRDGSQPVALMRETKTRESCRAEYRFMSHTPSDEVYAGRDEQLKIRLWEIATIFEAVHKIDAGAEVEDLHPETQDNTSVVQTVLAGFQDRLAIHEPGSVAFAGHSFGGATTVQLLKSAFYHPHTTTPLFKVDEDAEPPPAILAQITTRTPALLLDPWSMPWGSPATAELAKLPMPCFTALDNTDATAASDSLIAILSVSFFNWRANLRGVKRILRDRSGRAQPHVFYPQSSAHLSQSDFGVLFPSLTSALAGDTEPVRTLDLNLRGCLEILRRRGGSWAGIAPKEVDEDEAADEIDLGALVFDESGNLPPVSPKQGDWRILSRAADTVRGWVAVSFTDTDCEEDEATAGAAQTGDVAATTDLEGESAQQQLGMEAELKGAGLERAGSGRSGKVRIAMRRAGSNTSIKLESLRDAAGKRSQGHGRSVSKALLGRV